MYTDIVTFSISDDVYYTVLFTIMTNIVIAIIVLNILACKYKKYSNILALDALFLFVAFILYFSFPDWL